LSPATCNGLAVLKLKNGGKAVFATTNRGLHRSEDDGETWTFQEFAVAMALHALGRAARRQFRDRVRHQWQRPAGQ